MLNRTAYKMNIPSNRWTIGQLVWLEGKNLPLPYGMAKLAPRHHGPFKITKIISPVAVQLELPAQWSIHPVFHNSLLTPYTETPSHGPNFTRPPPDLIDGEEEYEVEQIRSHQTWGRRKTLQYLIKWKGYPKSDNTWEGADQVHMPNLIKLYHQTATQKTMKARQIQHKCCQFSHSLPFCYHVACLCPLTTKSSSAATIAYSSPPRTIGPIITNALANTNLTITASSARNCSNTRTILKPTSSTNTRLTLQLDDGSNRPHHSLCWTAPPKHLITAGCTTVTFPPYTAETANSSHLCFTISTSIDSSADSLDGTTALSA
jgi:hypothetical protein